VTLMNRAATEDEHGTAKRKLHKLAEKRLERFVTLVPKVLLRDDPDTIHHLRVASRRLQQTLRAMIERNTPAGRKIIRVLRRVRRALGACRNLDVNLDLIRHHMKESQSPALRAAWEPLGAHLKNARDPLLTEARKQIAKQDLAGFIERARDLIGQAALDSDRTENVKARLADSMNEWDEAFRRATTTRTVENLHALRIATKRFRYRAELRAEIGSVAIAATVKDLKRIQTIFGDWHDRAVLRQHASEFLAQPDFLSEYPDRAGALLAEMNEDKQREPEAVERILSLAGKLRKRWDHHLTHQSEPTKPDD